MILNGMQIIVDATVMAAFKEDWSDVRSPSRAERRRKRGFRQNIKIVPSLKPDVYVVGNRAIVSSETYQKIRQQVGR